jgi:non-ribosomal peptide synthetase component F
VDYTALSLTEVRTGLDGLAQETRATFGGFDARQLNWRTDAARWSVAQCFEHLLTADRLMSRAAEAALNSGRPRTIWERLPVLPGVLGRMLIRSQTPGGARRFTAPSKAQPATSDIAADIIQRFVEQHRETVKSVQALDERDAARAIMTSPFIRVVTYSVLDGWRLMLAHDRRHFEQARRVTLSPGFPNGLERG